MNGFQSDLKALTEALLSVIPSYSDGHERLAAEMFRLDDEDDM